MASAKVMSNSVASSRKQGHLELGKKKLEEFRKKKAAKQNTEAQLSASLQQPSADNSMEQSLRLTTLDSTREKQSSFSTTGFFDEEQQPKQRATDQDIQRDHEFPSLRKDEDFASLEQGKVVNQLKSDMERLQEEIKAQMLAFESVKLEYTNAQLECNAADERAKLLASEVISLEEK
ncbi:hypothetical protein MUK42_07470, partial [Musa troglodytarum]